jgi:hypothetical protein
MLLRDIHMAISLIQVLNFHNTRRNLIFDIDYTTLSKVRVNSDLVAIFILIQILIELRSIGHSVQVFNLSNDV